MQIKNRQALNAPEFVAKAAFHLIREPDMQEEVWVFMLDTKHRVIEAWNVSRGTLDRSPLHPREVFRRAIMHGSARIMLAHNHPSGDTAPSSADISITRQLHDAGNILGIELFDHVIVSGTNPEKFVSMRAEHIGGF